jgi:CRISPR-associated protein Cmr6
MTSKPTPKLIKPPILPKNIEESQSKNKSQIKSNTKPKINNKNSGGGNHNHGGKGNGGGGNNNNSPSPWLNPNQEPKPDTSAGFVEYLRWMREPNAPYKEDTKVQILQKAQENAKYDRHLKRLNKRTELIAGKANIFEVSCPWRIRVGGHRGPEQILLPAFDALGLPYIPSSTLRGVARTQAIREFMAKENIDWKAAEAKIAPYFGSLEAEGENRGGKVVFLDAYPLPSKTGGLSLDIATSIWNWKDNTIEYKEPNPNPFLSLEKPTFLIGLRLVSGCEDRKEILSKVKTWLKTGLQAGIGSQINTGYGKLILPKDKTKSNNEFLRLEFELEGQLIHGAKKFNLRQPYQTNDDGSLKTDNRGNFKPNSSSVAEVRPTAFKSMLRYWFRAFALGVMSPQQVETWECQLFGAINPTQKWGWLEVNILSGEVTQKEPRPNRQGQNDPCGAEKGMLSLCYSVAIPADKKPIFSNLFKNLTWMMINLGGMGQGARRPCYSRKNRDRAPWYRGSTFYLNTQDSFWETPENIGDFQRLFRQRLREFYTNLQAITNIANIANIARNIQSSLEFDSPSKEKWYEAIDKHCCILVCGGQERNNKSFALSVLHERDFKVNNSRGELDYDPNLCGKTAKPSPVWICDLDDFQVVTIFGATVNPRRSFLQTLQQKANSYHKIFPLN